MSSLSEKPSTLRSILAQPFLQCQPKKTFSNCQKDIYVTQIKNYDMISDRNQFFLLFGPTRCFSCSESFPMSFFEESARIVGNLFLDINEFGNGYIKITQRSKFQYSDVW